MIKNFTNKSIEEFYITGKSKHISPEIAKVALRKVALRKLDYLNSAITLEDLKIPPANRLERLKGDLKDFYSIRINKQYRVIFKFINGNVYDVNIVDYH